MYQFKITIKMTQPNDYPKEHIPSKHHDDIESRLTSGGISASGNYEEYVPRSGEVEVGQNLVVAISSLTSETLLRSGVSLDAPVSSMTFKSEKLQDHRLTLNVEFMPGMYRVLLTGYETGPDSGKAQYASLGVKSDGSRILEFGREDFKTQTDSLLNGLPYFEGSAAEISIKVPPVETDAHQ